MTNIEGNEMADFVFAGPLDSTLAKAFDGAVTSMIELSTAGRSDLLEEHASVSAVVSRLGMRLLGDRGLLNAVIEMCADGPGEGDIEGALSVLEDMGVVDLSDEVLAQIHAVRS
jgi:hypothetical protein